MKKELVEKYINSKVKITLFDNDIVIGKLKRSDSEEFKNIPELYFMKKRYVVIQDGPYCSKYSCLFRSSHIKKLEVLNKC